MARPIVYLVAKQNIMSLAKDIVPTMVKESVDTLELQKSSSNNPALLVSSASSNVISENEVLIEAARSIPLEI